MDKLAYWTDKLPSFRSITIQRSCFAFSKDTKDSPNTVLGKLRSQKLSEPSDIQPDERALFHRTPLRFWRNP